MSQKIFFILLNTKQLTSSPQIEYYSSHIEKKGEEMKGARLMKQKKYRYPSDLLEVIEREANFNNRSENGEVIHMLQIAYGLKHKEEERKIADI